MNVRPTSCFTLSACLLSAGIAVAAVPLQLPVQGVLRDNAGLPVAEDVFEMTFSLYQSPEAADPVWTEVWAPADGEDCTTTPDACVHVAGGVFRVSLGTKEILGLEILKTNPGLWLGVTVETEPELPRRPLGSAPYARHAQDAESADSLNCSGCLEVEMLSDSARDALTAEALLAVEDAGYAKQPDLVISEENLPGDGLNEVSNGLLSNEFVYTFSLSAPVDIKDDFSPGVSASIQVPDVGTAQTLSVSIDITNSDLSTITVTLFDADGEEHVLWAESGAGDHLEATYPAPDAAVSGDLTSWEGRNPAGTWFLEVVDDGVKDQGIDGQIQAWTIQVDTLSNQQVAVEGDLLVNGTISGPSGITIGSGTAPCDAAHAGSISFDAQSQRLTLCTGSELLQLKACSTQCREPATVVCGEALTDGCDNPCEGTGTALNTTQCLVLASGAPCGQSVTDVCGNDCGLQGSSIDPSTCPDPATVACAVGIQDPCGNGCGNVGTGLNAILCATPEATACGLNTTDTCGNDCGEPGTACGNGGICVDSVCLALGGSPQNAGGSCKDIHDSRPDAPDGAYWIDPDGLGGGAGGFQVYCQMTLEQGGWTLLLNLDTDDVVRHDYDDTDFWLGGTTEGDVNTPLNDGFKGQAYSDFKNATEVLIIVHNEGSTVGHSSYNLLPQFHGSSLRTLMNTETDTTITAGAKSQAGSVGAPANGNDQISGDLFVDYAEPLLLNQTSGWNAANTRNRITTVEPNGNGYEHTFGGLGGEHTQTDWGIQYESAPISAYCTLLALYGDPSNYTTYPGQNNYPLTDCPGPSPTVLPIDTAIFFR